jgi:hypothetical protein
VVNHLEQLWTRALNAFPPSLEQYEILADELVKAWRSGDSQARESIRRRHPRLTNLSDAEISGTTFDLEAARFIIAREQRFESWAELLEHIQVLKEESSISKFESAIEAIINGDTSTLERLLKDNPDLIRQVVAELYSTRRCGRPTTVMTRLTMRQWWRHSWQQGHALTFTRK